MEQLRWGNEFLHPRASERVRPNGLKGTASSVHVLQSLALEERALANASEAAWKDDFLEPALFKAAFAYRLQSIVQQHLTERVACAKVLRPIDFRLRTALRSAHSRLLHPRNAYSSMNSALDGRTSLLILDESKQLPLKIFRPSLSLTDTIYASWNAR